MAPLERLNEVMRLTKIILLVLADPVPFFAGVRDVWAIV